jgi:hypothetical protein
MRERSFSVAALVTRIVVGVVGLGLFMGPALVKLLHLEGPDAVGMMESEYWVGLVAPAFFLGALWMSARVFDRIHRGDGFGPAMVRGLREIGVCLILGAFAATVVQPSVLYLMGNGFTEMRGVRFNVDVENLTFALIGFVFLVLARQGQALQSKLDEFV